MFLVDEFNKLKDEVSYTMVEEHVARVKKQATKTGNADASIGLEETGIAGTSKEDEKEGQVLKSCHFCSVNEFFLVFMRGFKKS